MGDPVTTWKDTTIDTFNGSMTVEAALTAIEDSAGTAETAAQLADPNDPNAGAPMRDANTAASACESHALNPATPSCSTEDAHKQYVIDAYAGCFGPLPEGDTIDWGRIKDQLEHTGTGGDTPDEFTG